MYDVNCPHHGDEALEYVRGRLDNAAALQAEEHLETCGHCSAWYEKTFAGEIFDTVDDAVGAGLREVPLPRRGRNMRWVAAAAAVTLMVAGYGWWHHSPSVTLEPVAHQPAIASFDFEGGAVTIDNAVTLVDSKQDVVAEHATEEADEVLSKVDLEDGGVGSWEIHA